MADRISALPLELTLMILSHLPLESLLSFGATSRLGYERHILSFKRLRLAVFQRRVYSMISFLQAGWSLPDRMHALFKEDPSKNIDYTVSVISPRIKYIREDMTCTCPQKRMEWRMHNLAVDQQQPKSLDEMVRIQNEVFSKVLNRYGGSLGHLEFMAHDINIEGAVALGTNCRQSLRHLALRLEHPHVRDGLTKPDAWFRPAPASTAWNALIGIGPYKHLGNRITGLTTLVLERAGITPWQLLRLVKQNRGLETLKLRTCNGAQPEFLAWLGGLERDDDEEEEEEAAEAGNDSEHIHVPGAKLKVLWLENCQQLLSDPREILDNQNQTAQTCDRGLEWVRGLKNLESLSFSECMNIPSEYVETANKMLWHIPELILPALLHPKSSVIEVDSSGH